MLIGYARVSTREQNLDLQLDALRRAGCEKIFSEKISGKLSERPELDRMLERLEPGDTIVCWNLFRLGRSHNHLVNLAVEHRHRQVALVFISEGIDTRTPTGRLFFNIMAGLAEYIREHIVENTIAGQQAARERGKHIGRPAGLSEADLRRARAVQLLRAQGDSFRDIAQALQISVSTAHKYAAIAL